MAETTAQHAAELRGVHAAASLHALQNLRHTVVFLAVLHRALPQMASLAVGRGRVVFHLLLMRTRMRIFSDSDSGSGSPRLRVRCLPHRSLEGGFGGHLRPELLPSRLRPRELTPVRARFRQAESAAQHVAHRVAASPVPLPAASVAPLGIERAVPTTGGPAAGRSSSGPADSPSPGGRIRRSGGTATCSCLITPRRRPPPE